MTLSGIGDQRPYGRLIASVHGDAAQYYRPDGRPVIDLVDIAAAFGGHDHDMEGVQRHARRFIDL